MLVSAWRTGHKLAWDVPRNCHTYLVEEVLAPHVTRLHASLLSRFIGFFRGLLATLNSEVHIYEMVFEVIIGCKSIMAIGVWVKLYCLMFILICSIQL